MSNEFEFRVKVSRSIKVGEVKGLCFTVGQAILSQILQGIGGVHAVLCHQIHCEGLRRWENLVWHAGDGIAGDRRPTAATLSTSISAAAMRAAGRRRWSCSC